MCSYFKISLFKTSEVSIFWYYALVFPSPNAQVPNTILFLSPPFPLRNIFITLITRTIAYLWPTSPPISPIQPHPIMSLRKYGAQWVSCGRALINKASVMGNWQWLPTLPQLPHHAGRVQWINYQAMFMADYFTSVNWEFDIALSHPPLYGITMLLCQSLLPVSMSGWVGGRNWHSSCWKGKVKPLQWNLHVTSASSTGIYEKPFKIAVSQSVLRPRRFWSVLTEFLDMTLSINQELSISFEGQKRQPSPITTTLVPLTFSFCFNCDMFYLTPPPLVPSSYHQYNFSEGQGTWQVLVLNEMPNFFQWYFTFTAKFVPFWISNYFPTSCIFESGPVGMINLK